VRSLDDGRGPALEVVWIKAEEVHLRWWLSEVVLIHIK
jgi:hypothetical protein